MYIVLKESRENFEQNYDTENIIYRQLIIGNALYPVLILFFFSVSFNFYLFSAYIMEQKDLI